MAHEKKLSSRYVLTSIAVALSVAGQAQVITTVAGGGFNTANGISATTALVSAPQGIAVDASGNIFYWDTNVNGVRKVDTSGVVNTVAGNGKQALAFVGSIGDG